MVRRESARQFETLCLWKSSISNRSVSDKLEVFVKSSTDRYSRWWIKAAAAFRDGIIDQTSDGITANQHGAYAIVMKNHEETMTAKEGLVRYLPSSFDPGIFKLISTIRSEVRSVVRVLRSWKLKSPLAPVSGLRYDGL